MPTAFEEQITNRYEQQVMRATNIGGALIDDTQYLQHLEIESLPVAVRGQKNTDPEDTDPALMVTTSLVAEPAIGDDYICYGSKTNLYVVPTGLVDYYLELGGNWSTDSEHDYDSKGSVLNVAETALLHDSDISFDVIADRQADSIGIIGSEQVQKLIEKSAEDERLSGLELSNAYQVLIESGALHSTRQTEAGEVLPNIIRAARFMGAVGIGTVHMAHSIPVKYEITQADSQGGNSWQETASGFAEFEQFLIFDSDSLVTSVDRHAYVSAPYIELTAQMEDGTRGTVVGPKVFEIDGNNVHATITEPGTTEALLTAIEDTLSRKPSLGYWAVNTPENTDSIDMLLGPVK